MNNNNNNDYDNNKAIQKIMLYYYPRLFSLFSQLHDRVCEIQSIAKIELKKGEKKNIKTGRIEQVMQEIKMNF